MEESGQMKIYVSASAGNLDAQLDPMFGRCPYFVIVDTETMEFEASTSTVRGHSGMGRGMGSRRR